MMMVNAHTYNSSTRYKSIRSKIYFHVMREDSFDDDTPDHHTKCIHVYLRDGEREEKVTLSIPLFLKTLKRRQKES